jgi:hypothetical protein
VVMMVLLLASDAWVASTACMHTVLVAGVAVSQDIAHPIHSYVLRLSSLTRISLCQVHTLTADCHSTGAPNICNMPLILSLSNICRTPYVFAVLLPHRCDRAGPAVLLGLGRSSGWGRFWQCRPRGGTAWAWG